MSEHNWLNGTYEDALREVAERSLLLKEASPALAALLGAGIGAGAGALTGKKKKLKRALLGGALGAGAGAGIGALLKHFRGGDEGAAPRSQLSQTERATHATKAQNARQELGILGADENKVNEAVSGLQRGSATAGQARRQLRHAVPDSLTQLHNIPDAVGMSVSRGRPADLLNQADFLGLKNVNPLGRHFSPTTATLALGANQVARHGPRNLLHGAEDLLRGQKFVPSKIQGWLQGRHEGRMADFIQSGHPAKTQGFFTEGVQKKLPAFTGVPRDDVIDALRKQPALARTVENAMKHHQPPTTGGDKPGLFTRVTGGAGPSMAFLAPLLWREWISGRGYRSGHQPIRDLVAANQALNR